VRRAACPPTIRTRTIDGRPDTALHEKGRPGFDLDGTLVDSVYQHVLAWREALEEAGIELAGWRIHRRIGMSGGLFMNALMREIGRQRAAGLNPDEARGRDEKTVEGYTA
jgi:beta-phosphoglucomutase-like phosphatase (HAD superfamily)